MGKRPHLKVIDSSGPGPAWVTSSMSSAPSRQGDSGAQSFRLICFPTWTSCPPPPPPVTFWGGGAKLQLVQEQHETWISKRTFEVSFYFTGISFCLKSQISVMREKLHHTFDIFTLELLLFWVVLTIVQTQYCRTRFIATLRISGSGTAASSNNHTLTALTLWSTMGSVMVLMVH